MRKMWPAGLLALWAILGAVLFTVLRETYWALLVESLLDRIAHGLGIERPQMTSVVAPLILAASISGLLVYGAYRIGRWQERELLSPKGDAAAGDAAPTNPIFNLPRDADLLDAVWRVFVGRWGERVPGLNYEDTRDQTGKFFDATDQIRQIGFEGKLPIWGKRGKLSELYEPIPPEYWRTRRILPNAILHPECDEIWIDIEVPLKPGEMANTRTTEWRGFMTNRDTVDKLWPAKDSD